MYTLFVVKGVIEFQCAFVIKLYGFCELNMNNKRVVGVLGSETIWLCRETLMTSQRERERKR